MGTGVCAQIHSGAGKMVKGFYFFAGVGGGWGENSLGLLPWLF